MAWTHSAERHGGPPVPRTTVLAAILGSLVAFGPLSIDMYLPALPAMAQEFRAGASEVQLTLTSCVFGLGLGQLVIGPLSDAVGRRRPLLVGLAGYAVFSVACALAPSPSALVVFRLLQALSGSAGLVIARAVVRDVYSGIALARFFSSLMLVMGVAPILAPMFGGQLIRVTSWRGVFVVLALIGLVLLVACALALPDTLAPTARAPGRLGTTMSTYRRLLADRAFLGHALAGGLGFAAMFAYISGSSFVFQVIYRLSPQRFSLVFAANAIGIVLLSQLNGRLLVNRFGPRHLLASGLVAQVLGGLALLIAVLAGAGLPWVLLALFVVVASVGLVLPNATALALGNYPEAAGSASALLGVAQFVFGGAIAPLVGIAGSGTALPMAITIVALPISALLALTGLGSRLPAHAGNTGGEPV